MDTASPEETELIDLAVSRLRDRLPSSWEIARSQRVEMLPGGEQRPWDGAIDVVAPGAGGRTTLAVEARMSLAPRDVAQLLPGLARSLRVLAHNVPLLVVAPWLSAMTQERLTRASINFIDLTGNIRVELDNPAVFIEATGETRNPTPPQRRSATIRGPKAARLIRVLADARPPYGVGELAAAAGLTPGYVSRLLETLDRDALVDRGRRGTVERVDVPGLLRAWAGEYDVFETNDSGLYVAAAGADDALRELATLSGIAVTGSFAASRIAPVAHPSLLAAYCEDVPAVAAQLGLLPAYEGANVVLLQAFDDIVWAGAQAEPAKAAYVAPSQVVVDCLTGNGRMPAEGEALLDWMTRNEDSWRAPSLEALWPPPIGT